MKKSEFEFMVLDTIMRQQVSYPRLVAKMANKLSVRKTEIKHYVKDTLKDYKRLGLLTMDDSKNFKFLDQQTFSKLYAPSPRFKSNKFNFRTVKENTNDGVEEFDIFSEEFFEAPEGMEFEEALMIDPLNPTQVGNTEENDAPKSNPPQDLAAVTNLEEKSSKPSPANEVTIKHSSKIVENISEHEKQFYSDDCFESPTIILSAPELHDMSKIGIYAEACQEQQKLETMSTPSIQFDLDSFKILNGNEVSCEFKVLNNGNKSTLVKEKGPQVNCQPSKKLDKITEDIEVPLNINSQVGMEKCVKCQDAVVALSQVEGFQKPKNDHENNAMEPRQHAREPIVLNSERVCLGRLRHMKKNKN